MSKRNLIVNLIKCSENIGSSASNDPKIYMQRSNCLMHMKEYELAVQDAEKAIAIDDKFRLAYYGATDCHLLLGKIEQAEEIMDKFRKIAPQISSINDNLLPKIERLKHLYEKIDEDISSGNISICLKSINEALEIAPGCWNLKFLKLKCLIISKQFKESKKYNFQLCVILPKVLNFVEPLKLYYDGQLEKSWKLLNQISLSTSQKLSSLEAVKMQAKALNTGISKG